MFSSPCVWPFSSSRALRVSWLTSVPALAELPASESVSRLLPLGWRALEDEPPREEDEDLLAFPFLFDDDFEDGAGGGRG